MRAWWSFGLVVWASCRIGFDLRASDRSDASPASDATTASSDAPPQTYATGANLRSIGTSGTAFQTRGSIGSGTTLLTLLDPLGTNPGPGDELAIGGEVLYIRQVNSTTQVTVQVPAVATHDMADVSIRRAFSSPQAWETARGGDLVAADRLELGLLYNDGPFTNASGNILEFSGSVTDASHYMHLTVGPGQRHTGLAGTGVVFDGRHQSGGIVVRDAFTRIDGLELMGFSTESTTQYAIHVEARETLLDGLVIHDFKTTASTAYGVMVIDAPGDYVVRNTFVYDGDTAFRIDHDAGQGTVENCTVSGLQRHGVRLTRGALSAVNVISVGNGSAGFRDEPMTMIQSHNISSDATASGPMSVTNVSPVALLVSPTDLHRRPGGVAENAGATLGFCCDIDGNVRPVGTGWDIGADER